MIKFTRLPNILAATILLSSCILPAQQADQQAAKTAKTGIFQGTTDIGPSRKGSTVYNRATGEYRLTGNGADLWGAADQFHFAWVRLTGDVTLTADIRFPTTSKQPLRKALLMVRQSLAPGSAYADIAIHGDGHIAFQYRKVPNGITADTTATQHNSTRLRIQRKGNQYTVYASDPGGKLIPMAPITINLHDPVYVGIGVCPHDVNGFEEAIFSHVKIERHAVDRK